MFYQNRCMGFCYYFFPCEIQPLNFQLLSHRSVKHKSKGIWLDISSWNSCTGPIFQRIRKIGIWELSICTKSIQETEEVQVKPKPRQWKYPDCCRLNTWSRYMYIHALLGTVNGLWIIWLNPCLYHYQTWIEFFWNILFYTHPGINLQLHEWVALAYSVGVTLELYVVSLFASFSFDVSYSFFFLIYKSFLWCICNRTHSIFSDGSHF